MVYFPWTARLEVNDKDVLSKDLRLLLYLSNLTDDEVYDSCVILQLLQMVHWPKCDCLFGVGFLDLLNVPVLNSSAS